MSIINGNIKMSQSMSKENIYRLNYKFEHNGGTKIKFDIFLLNYESLNYWAWGLACGCMGLNKLL